LRPNEYAQHRKPRFKSIVAYLTGKQSVWLVRGGYYTDLSYDVIHDVFVLFRFAKVEVTWFGAFASDQNFALFNVLHIN